MTTRSRFALTLCLLLAPVLGCEEPRKAPPPPVPEVKGGEKLKEASPARPAPSPVAEHDSAGSPEEKVPDLTPWPMPKEWAAAPAHSLAAHKDVTVWDGPRRHYGAHSFIDLFDVRGTSVERGRDRYGKTRFLISDGGVDFFDYDRKGRLERSRFSDGSEIRYHWNALGVIEWCFPPRGKKEKALPYKLQAVFLDSKGRPAEVFSGQGRKWAFGWKKDRLVSEAGPRGERSYDYAADGSLEGWSDSSGVAVRVERSANTLSATSRTGARVHHTRDGKGLLVEAVSNGSRLSFSYDPQGKLLEARGREAVRSHEGPEQDGLSKRELITPWGRFETTRMSGIGLVGIESPAGRFVVGDWVNYPNGIRAEFSGKHRDQVQSQALKVKTTWSKRHLLATRERDGVITRYGYDRGGRLIRAERAGRVQRWKVDPSGRRLQGVHAWTYNKLGWPLTRGPQTFRHDAAGRLLERVHRRGADHFRYDGFGRLVEVRRAGSPAVHYRYDGLGRLAARRVKGRETRYVYDGLFLLAEVGPGSRYRLYTPGSALDQRVAYTDETGRSTYLHSDTLGSVLAYSNASGKVVARARFDPFGQLEETPKDQPVFYAGALYDPVARLLPMRARFYDPELGRFLSADPAGLRDGFDPFVYAHATPTDHLDPFGLYTILRSQRRALGLLSPTLQLAVLQALGGVYFAPNPVGELKNLPKPATKPGTPKVSYSSPGFARNRIKTMVAIQTVGSSSEEAVRVWNDPLSAGKRSGAEAARAEDPDEDDDEPPSPEALAAGNAYAKAQDASSGARRSLKGATAKLAAFREHMLGKAGDPREFAKAAKRQGVTALLADWQRKDHELVEAWHSARRSLKAKTREVAKERYWQRVAASPALQALRENDPQRQKERRRARRKAEQEIEADMAAAVRKIPDPPNLRQVRQDYDAWAAKERAIAAKRQRKRRKAGKRGKLSISVSSSAPQRARLGSETPTISGSSRGRKRGGVSVSRGKKARGKGVSRGRRARDRRGARARKARAKGGSRGRGRRVAKASRGQPRGLAQRIGRR